MYYWSKEPNKVVIECDKCGKILKFDDKYFSVGNNYCSPNTLIQCPCGNSTTNTIYSKNSAVIVEGHGNTAINKPKCPTCHSTNIEKISGTNKVAAVALFGVFSLGHIDKTFKCKNCGYKW